MAATRRTSSSAARFRKIVTPTVYSTISLRIRLMGKSGKVTRTPYEKNMPGLQKPYSYVASAILRFGHNLPGHLANSSMHLDPDFSHLTYGDQGERAKQIRSKLAKDDLLVF